MNQRLRPLSCFLTLAVLAVCSTDAVARASHRPQQAKKPHQATGARHHREAALKKAGHAKHVAAAQRKSTRVQRRAASECGRFSALAAILRR